MLGWFLPLWLRSKECAYQYRRHRRCGLDSWVGKIPWRRAWKPTPVFLPGEPMDRGAWWATVHGAAESRTRVKGLSMHACRVVSTLCWLPGLICYCSLRIKSLSDFWSPEMTLLELSLPQKIKFLMIECKERQVSKISFHQSYSVVNLEKKMDFVSENEKRELGEGEGETQLSSTSRHGRDSTSHPWLLWVRATAFQRHRRGFQGERWLDHTKADAESLALCHSFPCIHSAERSRGKKSPMGSKLEERSRVLAFSIPVVEKSSWHRRCVWQKPLVTDSEMKHSGCEPGMPQR